MLQKHKLFAIALTAILHAALYLLAFEHFASLLDRSSKRISEPTVLIALDLEREPPVQPIKAEPILTETRQAISDDQRAFMTAPPAPTAQDCVFASNYTNKNSKGYRYFWGQQVRSMMGTAYEGTDEGMVRFRVEIAPNGKLTRLETLWATSSKAEQLARRAVITMPALPPTPTGKPLVFERTIRFTAFESEAEPSYKDDCEPEPVGFRNPFAWDGRSHQENSTSASLTSTASPLEAERSQALGAQAMADCLRQLPQDTIEAEEERAKRMMARWRWK